MRQVSQKSDVILRAPRRIVGHERAAHAELVEQPQEGERAIDKRAILEDRPVEIEGEVPESCQLCR